MFLKLFSNAHFLDKYLLTEKNLSKLNKVAKIAHQSNQV